MRCDNDSKALDVRKLIISSWFSYRTWRIRHDMLITWSSLSVILCELLLLVMRKMRAVRRMKRMRKMMKKRTHFMMSESSFSGTVIKNSLSWRCDSLWMQMRRMMMRCRFWECSVCLIHSSFKQLIMSHFAACLYTFWQCSVSMRKWTDYEEQTTSHSCWLKWFTVCECWEWRFCFHSVSESIRVRQSKSIFFSSDRNFWLTDLTIQWAW